MVPSTGISLPFNPSMGATKENHYKMKILALEHTLHCITLLGFNSREAGWREKECSQRQYSRDVWRQHWSTSPSKQTPALLTKLFLSVSLSLLAQSLHPGPNSWLRSLQPGGQADGQAGGQAWGISPNKSELTRSDGWKHKSGQIWQSSSSLSDLLHSQSCRSASSAVHHPLSLSTSQVTKDS